MNNTKTPSQTIFLKDWTPKQFDLMQRAIKRYFTRSACTLKTNNGIVMFSILDNYDSIADVLGLAYTSSSSMAGLWICNVDAEHIYKYEGYRYIGFVMDNDCNAYALLWDKDENEIQVPI